MGDDEVVVFQSIDDDTKALLDAIAEARQNAKAWADQEKTLGDQIKKQFGHDCVLLYEGDTVGDLHTVKSNRFDRKTFALDWPRLDREYNKETTYRKLSIYGSGDMDG